MRKRRVKRILCCLLAFTLMFGNVQGLSVLAAEETVGVETEVLQESETSEEIVVPEESVPDVEKEESSEQESEETLKAETGAENKEENSVKEEKAEPQKTEEKTEIFEEKSEETEIPVKIEGPTMEITDEDLQNNSYEIYYHVEDITYTYKGEVATFVSETEFTAGGQTYSLKNKLIKVIVQEAEDGTVSVKLEGVKTPVGSISGAWNSEWGGSVQLSYKTDIPGMEEVRSAEGSSLKDTIELKELKDGTYHLTEGAIYEKANEFSPGYDFGDGKGVVKEGFFGTLPDITLVIEGTDKPEPQPASARLKSLEVIGGTIEPAFHPDTISYTLKVPQGTKTVTMNMEAESKDAGIAITNTADPSSPGKPGSPLVVEDGKRISVMVMNGTLFKSYNFVIQVEEEEPEKPVKPTEKLKDLHVTGGTLAPTYDEKNSSYTLYVSEDTKSVSIHTITYTEDTKVSIQFEKQKYQQGDEIPVIDGKTIRVTGTLKQGALTSSKSYFLTFKVMKKSELGFSFILDENDLKIKEDGIHEDGMPYWKVLIPEGTKEVTMARSKEAEAIEHGIFGKTIVTKGIGEAKFSTTSYIGKANYFIVKVEKEQYYVYFQEVPKEEDASLPRMNITEEDLKANQAYETYYYSDQINYYYQDEFVEFTDENHFSAGGETYELKNKKTTISVETSDKGSATVKLANLMVPVGSIPGQWNSGYKAEVVYQTDIPGKEEIRSGELANPLVFEGLPDGTYHLTKGSIFEKANEYSPGYDFGDGNGVVKEKYFGTLPDITFTIENSIEKPAEYLGVPTKAKVYDDFENDIWLQYQQKELKVGDTADLYPWRLEQIVTDTINNDVFRPNFHFEIISGDSVELSTMTSNEKTVVTAVKQGTSIVKVTYDATDYKGKHWDGISDVNTGYVVFTVGENGKAVIQTNDTFKNWRHYDTIYYTEGETVPYTFTVNTENAKSVRVTVNGLPIEGNGNSYTANLENRSNIIGIEAKDADGNVTSVYRVIDARFMEVVVENKTNPGQMLNAGDTANVRFRGITMPVHKLATIYNPVFGKNVTRVLYENDELGTFEGKCSQWDLATNNDFDVTFAKKGTYNFHSKEGIRCVWWGDELGADMIKQGVGEPNLKANDIVGYFSTLPDFTIEVAGDETENPDPEPEVPDKPEEPEQEPTEEDIAAAEKVMEQIAKLGSHVTLKQEAEVKAVRAAYEKLTDLQKKLVKNYDVLVAAEERIQLIKDILPEIPTIEVPDKEEGKPEGGNALGGGSKGGSSSGGSVKRVNRVSRKTSGTASKVTSNTEELAVENHLVAKEEIEKIKGKDKNLRLIDSLDDGTKYSMTLNGKEITEVSDINTALRKESIYEKEIKMLAPDPEILVFEQKGNFPGKVLVKLDVKKDDGTYLLFKYDNIGKKADYVQKVEVKDGKTKFFVTEGGDYFIDTKAKVKSIDELAKDEEKNWEEDVMEVSQAEDEGKDYGMLLIGILIGLGAAGVFGAGFLIGKKGRKTNE